MKLGSAFQIIQGHQITDEEIYSDEGTIPVLTSKNDIKGYWSKKIIEEDQLPCITYPTKANSGCAYTHTEIFDANNTAILLVFDEWKDKINLEWFAYKLRPIFLECQTSKGGVSYLNKDIVEDIEVNIPSMDVQLKEKELISGVLRKKEIIEKILIKISKIKNNELEEDYKILKERNISTNIVFDVLGGNSGLTEEYIYSQLENSTPDKYILLTGSMKSLENPTMISKLKHPKKSEKTISVFDGEGIHIIRKGKAGSTYYLPKGKYTLNDDAYILKVKDDYKDKLNLKWFFPNNIQPASENFEYSPRPILPKI